MPEIPTKPYLIRAIYEWCTDNGYTPHVKVKVDHQTRVPVEFVKNGELVLNIGPLAVDRLVLGNDTIEFAGRFRGVARDLSIPVATVARIFARENGVGLSFEVADSLPEPAAQSETPPDPDRPAPPAKSKPSLRRVK